MGIRYGHIKPDVFVSGIEPAEDGHLRVRLRQWKSEPRVADIAVLGDCDDDNLVAFAEIVAIEGEWPEARPHSDSTVERTSSTTDGAVATTRSTVD